jgi:hypothetical protein
MSNAIEDVRQWQDLTIDDLIGGLVLDADSEVLEKNELTLAECVVLREKKLRRDTGYTTYLSTVRGNPRRHYSYVDNDGLVHEILITDLTVYKQVNDQWRYISDGTSTTLSGNEAAGQTVLSISSAAGLANGDFVGIVLDTGQMHMTTIVGAPAATMTVANALPSAAASGNAVVKAVVLAGIASKHITAVVLPWSHRLVFTNGVDPVKRYDPSLNTVTTLTGYTDIICQTLALYDNSLVLGNTTESGDRFPFRVRYSAKGDEEELSLLEAGYIDIMDTSDDIIQMLKLGPYLVLYRDNSIGRMAISSGGLRRFDTQTTVSGTGIFCNFGVIDLIDRHIMMGNNNFYWYKGGFAVEEIGNPIKDYVFGESGLLAGTNRAEAFAVLLPQKNEILYFFKSDDNGEDNIAVRYHLDSNKWTTRKFAHTFSGFGEHIVSDSTEWSDLDAAWGDVVASWAGMEASGERRQIVLCAADPDQSMIYDYTASTDAGDLITMNIETKDFSHPKYLIKHDSLTVGVYNGNLTVEISTDKGGSWTAMGGIISTGVAKRYRIDYQVTCEHFRYRFTSNDPAIISFLHIHFKYEFEW